MRAVVGRIVNDGVVGDAQLIQQVQQLTHMHVMFDHACGVFIGHTTGDLIRLCAHLVLHMGAEMHARAVPPDIEWLTLFIGTLDEVDGGGDGFLIHRFHALAGQRAGVFDLAIGAGLDHAARAIGLAEGAAVCQNRVTGIIFVFRFLFGVQVVEVAEKLIKPVVCGQMLILVAQMVLAELTGHVAVVLQQARDGRVFGLHAKLGPRQPHLGQARAEH